jgi:hypothetical protein
MPATLPFNPLDWPILFTPPPRLTLVSAWKEHVPFAFFLTAALRPRAFVELGTHNGDSYLAFCEAIKRLDLPTRAHAVDTWQGDEHSGRYSNEVYDGLRAAHDPAYSSFSTLHRMTFDEALSKFDDGSIDLLHIDGLHTYEAVKHDYGTWRPKVADGGVILFHDTAVRERGFGVYRLMDDLRAAGHALFEFEHGHGLGVLPVGAGQPQAFKDFFATARQHPVAVRNFFGQLGNRLSLQVYCDAVQSGHFGPVQRARRAIRRVARGLRRA